MIHKTSTQRKTGVADYFAILGIPSFTDDATGESIDKNDNGEVEANNNNVTPRNDNLSSSEEYNDLQNINSINEEETKMHQEIFNREIIQLGLLSPDLESIEEKWTICHSHESCSDNHGNKAVTGASTDGSLNLYRVPLNISGVHHKSVQLA